jgi:hypothetical protein
VKAIVSLCSALLIAAVLGPGSVLAVVTGPGIHVEKLVNDFANTESGCRSVEAGATVFYTFYVSNAGSVALANIQVTDAPGGPPAPILGTDTGAGFNIGDRNHNDLLDLGEIWQFAADTTALPGQHDDLATASGDFDTVTVSDDDPGCYVAPLTAVATTLTYDGPVTGDFNDAAEVSATLIEADSAAPVVGATISFSLNATETCEGETDEAGQAGCVLTPGEAAGVYPLTASFAGDDAHLASDTATDFTVTLEETSLTLAADAFTANGQPTTLSSVLTDPGDEGTGEVATPISGKLIWFTLGSGASAQWCSGLTDVSGAASCTISLVSQALGPVDIAASFAGDEFDQPASATGATIVFSPLASGAFAVGDISAVPGATVTWWSPTWSSANVLGTGPAPSAFKGFINTLSDESWSAAGGSSGGAPASTPSYLSVVVVDSASKSGSTISGTATGQAIVLVNPGYDPEAGVPGTGVLLGFVP